MPSIRVQITIHHKFVKQLFFSHPHQTQTLTSYITNNQQQQHYALRGRVLYIMY